MKRFILRAIILLMMGNSLHGKVLFVDNQHTSASDTNPGTEDQPWKTIQKAARSVNAGDTIYVKKGTYKGEVKIERSGTKDNYILFSAYPGHEEQVINDGSQIILIEASYVHITGFYIQNTNNHGIAVRGMSDGLIISGNHTYDTYGSGISVWGVDWGQDPSQYDYDIVRDILIENNKVEKACNGGWNECITLSNGVNGFKIINNEVYNGGDPTNGGEGIDIKEGCWDGLISGNIVHDLTRRGIYLDGGGHMDDWDTPPLRDIFVTNNVVYSNPQGQAMAIMTEGSADVHSIYIYNNLFYDNGEDGIMFYDHPNGDGDIYDIIAANNTCYGNKRFGILLNFPDAKNITIRNNICYKSGDSNFRYSAGEYEASNNLSKNPLFVDAANGDFHLLSDSPAIDAGTDVDAPSVDFDGNQRPQGDAFDIGAYEYAGTSKVMNKDSNLDDYALFPNVPNPFNPLTTIRFQLPRHDFVELNIYDISGRLIANLLKGDLPAGIHNLNWAAGGHASGVYFYSLKTGDYSNTKRMLLLQ